MFCIHNTLKTFKLIKFSVFRLGSLIKNTNAETQVIYKTLHCLWLMSYNRQIGQRFNETNVIIYIIAIMRAVPKEKIIRMGCAVLAVC